MNPSKEIAREAQGVDRSHELTDEDLDKVSGGHASLGDLANGIKDKVARAQAKASGFGLSGADVAKITGIDVSGIF